MYLDLSGLTILFRILKDKLIFYHHLACLPEEALAHQVLTIQEKFHFPNLLNDISHFLNKHEISNVCDYSKQEWRKFVKKTIDHENRESLLEASKKYKKLDYLSLSLEEAGIKEYFLNLDLAGARMRFKERSNCVSTCKDSYRSKHLTSMFCNFCSSKSICNLNHWRICSGYSQYRISRDLSLDSHLVAYLQDIIELRKSELENNN